jgi:hypothetical protein
MQLNAVLKKVCKSVGTLVIENGIFDVLSQGGLFYEKNLSAVEKEKGQHTRVSYP